MGCWFGQGNLLAGQSVNVWGNGIGLTCSLYSSKQGAAIRANFKKNLTAAHKQGVHLRLLTSVRINSNPTGPLRSKHTRIEFFTWTTTPWILTECHSPLHKHTQPHRSKHILSLEMLWYSKKKMSIALFKKMSIVILEQRSIFPNISWKFTVIAHLLHFPLRFLIKIHNAVQHNPSNTDWPVTAHLRSFLSYRISPL